MTQFVEVGAYDAKTHFPEFLRKARAGVIFRITNRGEHVADLGPPGPTQRSDRVNAALRMLNFMQSQTPMAGLDLTALPRDGRD